MFKLQQYEVKETTDYNYYNSTQKFGSGKNLTFTFGMSSGLNEEIGVMKAYYHGYAPEGPSFEEVPTRNCTLDDFGIGKNTTDSWFLPVK